MAKPDQEFIDSGEGAGCGPWPIGSAQGDLNAASCMLEEAYNEVLPKIPYYSLDRDKTQVDSLYKEALPVAIYHPPVDVPIRAILRPQLKLLKKFGIEEEQDAIFIFNNKVNQTLGIQPMTGDQVQYIGVRFEILTVKFTDYYLNTQTPLTLTTTAKNLNPR